MESNRHRWNYGEELWMYIRRTEFIRPLMSR